MNSSVYSIGDSLYKKATQFYNDYILSERDQNEKTVQEMLQEINHGEIIFSKNNVCIHTNELPDQNLIRTSTSSCSKNCIAGYFSIKLIKCQPDNLVDPSVDEIHLTNKKVDLIKQTNQVKETSFIEKKQFNLDKELKKDEQNDQSNNVTKSNDLNQQTKKQNTSNYLKKQTESKDESTSDSSFHYSMIITWMANSIFEEKSNKLTRNLSLKSTGSMKKSFDQSLRRSKSLNSLNSIGINQTQHNSNHFHPNYHLHHTTSQTSSYKSKNYASDSHLNLVSNSYNSYKCTASNRMDEDNFIFSINIKKVKSLKLFFGLQMIRNLDDDNSEHSKNTGKDGQLVIGNYDLQYKIFHFHNGGLSKLEKFLSDWNFVFCLNQKKFNNSILSLFESVYEEPFVVGDMNNSLLDFYMNKFVQLKNQKQIEKEYNNNNVNCIQLYTINLPALNYLDLQNEYSTYRPIAINNLDEYHQFFSPDGQMIFDLEKFKTRVFFSGVEENSRKYFYPYLLNRFSANLTSKEKNEIIKHGEFLYKNIDEKRRNIKKEDTKFYRKFNQYRNTILVDLPRTDRCNKLLQDKAKLNQMERILLNYTLYSRIGYTQGFSDLLAPLVIILRNEPESEIFFNFVCLIEKKSFFCLPNDDSIDGCMGKIRELLRVLDVRFYDYFKEKGEQSFQLLFTHRWMLLCFRREFDKEFHKIWEACWSEFQAQFQLFICIAIIQIYGQNLIEKQMNSDDILFYFGNLSQKMNADLVLKKARGNLFQFRSLNKIPCTLRSLCNLNFKSKPNNPSNWTTQIQPFFECAKSTSEPSPDAILLCTCDCK